MLTPSETKTELANALSHGLGILFTIIASPVLIVLATQKSNDSLTLAVALYCFSMLQLFTFSTLYHAFANPLVKKILRIFDHISIFFLIGGTCIPFVVLFTSHQTAFWFFIIQWTLILAGVILKIFYTGKFRLLSTLIYIFIGCLTVFLGKDFFSQMPQISIYLLLAGGIFYLGGTIFYQNRKIPYNHFIWHLFVLSAAIFHYFAILTSVTFS